MKNWIFLCLILLIPNLVWGQCCSGGVPISSNIGMALVEKGTWQIGISYDNSVLKTLKTGSNTLDDDSRTRITNSILAAVGFAFGEKLSMDVLMPWIRQERVTLSHIGERNFTYAQGIGDAVFLLKYNVLVPLTIGYGIKAPTGTSDRTNEGGLPMFADMQPGSGAWDHLGYLRFSRQFNFRATMSYFSTMIYRSTGTNNNYLNQSSYAFGNEFQVMLGVSDQIYVYNILLDPSLVIRYRNAQRDEFNHSGFISSGGDFLFINPGASWQITPKFSFQLNAEFPIYSKVNEVQLSPSYRINTGILYVIRKNKIVFKL